MSSIFLQSRRFQFCFIAAISACLAMTAVARAGGGEVLPPNANQKGYSLSDAAGATAVANTGGPAVTNLPFQLLNGDATVKPGTMLYVPVFFADDSGVPDPAPFPTNLNDQNAIADYLIDAVNAFIHSHGAPPFVEITDLFVEVDGKITVLGDSSVVGVTTAPLPDGSPAGTHYIVSAAFLTPLTPGTHTVAIGGDVSVFGVDAGPTVAASYTVTVR
jgi:hypothetical protein